MTKAEELLNSLDETDESLYPEVVEEEPAEPVRLAALYAATATETDEPHAVIFDDRSMYVPDSIKKIGVQFDHDVNLIRFDCPRYSDGVDLYPMQFYVNYIRPDGTPGAYHVEDVTIDETDSTILHFSWHVLRHATEYQGNLTILVCVKETDVSGNLEHHWNTELNTDFYLSEGLECADTILAEYPDIITQLLTEMDVVKAIATPEAMQGYANAWLNQYGAETVRSVEQKGHEVLASIPEDYTQLSNDVNELKGDLIHEVGHVFSKNYSLVWNANGYLETDGTIKKSSEYNYTDYFNLDIGDGTIPDVITVTKANSEYAQVGFYSEDNTFISPTITIRTDLTSVINVPSTAKKAIFSVNKNDYLSASIVYNSKEKPLNEKIEDIQQEIDLIEIDGYSKTDKKNLLKDGTLVNDRYVELSGSSYIISTSSGYKYYKVPVITGRKLNVTGVYGYDIRPVVFVNDLDELVGCAPLERVTPIREESIEVKVPENATFALVTGYVTTDIVCEQDGYAIYKKNSNVLSGKKLVSAGDSITEALQADGKSYAWHCAKYYDMDFLNIGLSGRTMADCKDANGNSLNGFSVDRYTLVPDDADILTIMFGWNDFYYGPLTHKNEYCLATYGVRYDSLTESQKAEADAHEDWESKFIGTLDSTDTKTWCGAWKFILNYFTVTKPIERLGVLLPYATPSDMVTDARSKLVELCKQYGVSYLDTMNPCDMPSIGFSESGQANASTLKAKYTADTTHPNALGHERMSRGYIPWIAKL